jgi:hypothetical protein
MALHALVQQGSGAFGHAKLQPRGNPFYRKGCLLSHARRDSQLAGIILQAGRQILFRPAQAHQCLGNDAVGPLFDRFQAQFASVVFPAGLLGRERARKATSLVRT